VLLPTGAVVLGVAELGYALERSTLWELCLVTAVAGLGVGTSFAGLPVLVVATVPQRETGSAMSLNQVLRYVGFAAGSATTATALAAATPEGAAFPGGSGYTLIAVVGCVACVLMALVTWLLPDREPAAAAPVSPATR
jgi:MFS family permease